MREPLLQGGPAVCSLHNFFSLPARLGGGGSGGDAFLLSSPDEEQRQKAVQWTLHTLHTAAELGAEAVVLHCGRVEMKTGMDRIYGSYRRRGYLDGKAESLLADRISEREDRKPPHVEALCRSLDALVPEAEACRVRLGLENRYHYHELPGMDEFRTIFQRYSSDSIGYWHDMGHAHAQQCLRIPDQDELPAAFSHRLVGVHLHDAVGLDDHLPPGDGEMDFSPVARAIGPDTLRVMELKPGTDEEGIRRGLAFLRERMA
jgi:sugar phosphate isomerase/epimerase